MFIKRTFAIKWLFLFYQGLIYGLNFERTLNEMLKLKSYRNTNQVH